MACLAVCVDDDDACRMLAPVVDMLNYEPQARARGVMDGSAGAFYLDYHKASRAARRRPGAD